MTYRTTLANPRNQIPVWYHIDADQQVVGRLATEIAMILMGKNKAIYTPFVDTGDFVIVTNCEKVTFTGNKWTQKMYRHHTRYISGLVEKPAYIVREQHPERILQLAVRRMLPKTKLGRQMLKKLKIYSGPHHPHAAQTPIQLESQQR